MTRYEFLKYSGFTGGALFALLACVNEEDTVVDALTRNPDGSFINPDGTLVGGSPTGSGPDQDFVISTEELEAITPLYRVDTSGVIYAKMLVRNTYVVLGNSIVLALSKEGQYIAATVVCSHENKRAISYSNGEWFCPLHGARYTPVGKGVNANGSRGIKVYKTAFDGQTVFIYE